MPSPRRTSPSMRPTSPLSPRFEPTRFEPLQPPSPRPHSRQGNGSRRANTNSLKLPQLPRFHPANFPSAHSSFQTTPDGNPTPGQPMSPRSHQRMYSDQRMSDAQKQLLMYHRESIAAFTRGTSPSSLEKPASPRLEPLGSPGGPVTPLELEAEGGYLTAHAGKSGTAAHGELVDRLIEEESKRSRRASQGGNGNVKPTYR